MSTFSLRARVVFPIDRPPIEHGVVAVDGERIVAVGGSEVAVGEVRDLGDVALLPGFVNAHTHLEFSDLKQPLGAAGMPLVDWIQLVIDERGRRSNPPAESIAEGLRESVCRGVTTIGDIATADIAAYADVIVPDISLFVEVIGFSRARAASAFVAVTERLNAMREQAAAPPNSAIAGRIQIGISPHAPYTVSPAPLRDLIALASRDSLPVAMHLAESAEELELLVASTGPFAELLDERSMWDPLAIPHRSRPLHYLQMLAAAPRALVIHGNYLDAEERAFLASHRQRMTLVYCPRTHAYFGHPPYPLAELLASGVRVALGTDSRASNPDLDVLAEMRHITRAHPTIDPLDVLAMGTLAGAEALEVAERAGSLAAGKLANLVSVPLPERAAGSPRDVFAALLAGNGGVRTIWLHGQEVV